MAKRRVSRSVLHYKRMIALTIFLTILTLFVLSVCLGIRLYHMSGALEEAQSELAELKTAEAQRRAEEEAERVRSALPAERPKPAGEQSAPEILSANPLIAHALGDVDGLAGLNCLEGFLQHYEAGVRVFEVDLRMTSDGHVVLRHDWIGGLQEGVDPTHIPTLDEFLAKPILDKYTPLSFRDLLELMTRYPDVCIITDTKLMDEEPVTAQFSAMLEDARALGMSYLFDRMAIQVYSPAHFHVVDGLRHFPYYIYTLYQESFEGTEDAFRRKTIFCMENGIMGLTIGEERWDEDYLPIANWRNIRVFLHTINDARKARGLLASGVSGVYTDELVPTSLTN